ncbi:MAG: hypothetical protein IJ736_07350 [Firmicutes bacterium]|nr:hypothetical protein [Bacillota bacterium]
MDILYKIFGIVHDAGITLVILAVIIKAGQNPKYILAYMLFIGILLLLCKATSFY